MKGTASRSGYELPDGTALQHLQHLTKSCKWSSICACLLLYVHVSGCQESCTGPLIDNGLCIQVGKGPLTRYMCIIHLQGDGQGDTHLTPFSKTTLCDVLSSQQHSTSWLMLGAPVVSLQSVPGDDLDRVASDTAGYILGWGAQSTTPTRTTQLRSLPVKTRPCADFIEQSALTWLDQKPYICTDGGACPGDGGGEFKRVVHVIILKSKFGCWTPANLVAMADMLIAAYSPLHNQQRGSWYVHIQPA